MIISTVLPTTLLYRVLSIFKINMPLQILRRLVCSLNTFILSLLMAPLFFPLSLLENHLELTSLSLTPMFILSWLHCAIALYTAIFYLFSLSLKQDYLPAEWCIHQITLIPISQETKCVLQIIVLFPCFVYTISKVLEHIVYDKVVEFLSVQISLRTVPPYNIFLFFCQTSIILMN